VIESIMLAALLGVQLSPLGYVVIGMGLCILGVLIILATLEIPIVNLFASAVGWFLIVLGGAVGLYGISPEIANFIFTGGFLVIWLIGVIIIIIYEIRMLRR